MANKLEGKVAVITGGNSGIGLATAKLFQAEGATVVITGRRKEAVETAVKEIGGKSIGFISDTADLQAIRELYRNVNEQVGKIDVLFLNAGIAKFGPVDSVDEATFDEIMNVNLKGLFFNVQHALPVLNDHASIILTTTMADQKGYPGTTVYSASKAAVRSLARTLSAELLERGIRVNAIAPGPIDTPIFAKLGIPEEGIPDTKEGFRNAVPMKRFGSADEVAKPALFLASDDSSYVLGVELTVDGGIAQL